MVDKSLQCSMIQTYSLLEVRKDAIYYFTNSIGSE